MSARLLNDIDLRRERKDEDDFDEDTVSRLNKPKLLHTTMALCT
ncbi:hypothetical protein QUF72_05065 [Desulfobacterales bacterium HSG2]|nr:hypothetical protein [Desulfobacterales bacterium HSG2]